uniref:Uncharacterized protein n=1 Tax=Meloidogyne incognita TaxID=6306 RepID=A0A914MMF7_MELIC
GNGNDRCWRYEDEDQSWWDDRWSDPSKDRRNDYCWRDASQNRWSDNCWRCYIESCGDNEGRSDIEGWRGNVEEV